MKKLTKLNISMQESSDRGKKELNREEKKLILGGFSDATNSYDMCASAHGCAYGCFICCRLSTK